MFMRIAWAKVEPGLWSQFEAKYREVGSAMPPGLTARWLVQDTHDPDAGFFVTLWESADAIRNWESSSDYRDSFIPIRPFLIGNVSVSVCEVKFAQETP
jgi:heme-degrading monooxygenase HmoA